MSSLTRNDPASPRPRMDETHLHRAFKATLLLKGLHALVELAGGLLLYTIGTGTIVQWLYGAEALRPDWLTTHIDGLAHGLSLEPANFYAFYFLSHGAVNLALVIGLWRHRSWAYPANFVVLSAFIAYQLHRYVTTPDAGLLLLSALDLLVMALAWQDYRSQRRRRMIR